MTHAANEDILDYRRHVCLRVIMKYKDIFSWRKRRASFAFYVNRKGLLSCQNITMLTKRPSTYRPLQSLLVAINPAVQVF